MAPHDPERIYTELLFASSRTYAAWDQELEVRVGDYGIITRGERASFLKFWARDRRQGVFLKQGNIYDNGKAESIPDQGGYNRPWNSHLEDYHQPNTSSSQAYNAYRM